MPPYDTGRWVTPGPAPSIGQVAVLALALVAAWVMLDHLPALVRWYRQGRARRTEARRLRIMERTLKRSTWPCYPALPFNQQDVSRRTLRIRLVKQPRKVKA